jgi:putative addiction module component (TIGR02574 family)
MTVEERLQLIDDVWASLEVETSGQPSVPAWHIAVLDERLAAHRAEPAAARSWAEVRAEVEAELRAGLKK